MAIKITMRYHYIPFRMAKIKKIVITLNAGEDIEKLKLAYIACENIK